MPCPLDRQFVAIVAGLLPFGSIFIETYFVFTSFWNYKVGGRAAGSGLRLRSPRTSLPPPSLQFYYVYGFMLAVYFILSIVVSCVTVVATYFLLNGEGAHSRYGAGPRLCPLRVLPPSPLPRLPPADYRWQWHSFFCGASTGLYVLLYSVYYFLFRTEMTGFLQTVFYFAYMLLGSSALGLVTGTIGIASAGLFVRAIFSSIKVD